jgi:prepilin-type N-terminal cleavage/methylation domain-containing protein
VARVIGDFMSMQKILRSLLATRRIAGDMPATSVGRARPHAESGMTIVEVMIAMAVIAVGALSALSTLTGSSALDDELKERAVAVRAAMSKMESIAAYDYNNQITNLVNYWTATAQQTFSVEGLAAPVAQNGTALPHGSIAFNTADPNRIRVTVTVSWTTRQGQTKTLSLPRVFTEVIK